MCDCFFEWHCQNLNSQATATLVHTIEPHLLCAAPCNPTTTEQAQTIYQLTANDHIAVLEAKLLISELESQLSLKAHEAELRRLKVLL